MSASDRPGTAKILQFPQRLRRDAGPMPRHAKGTVEPRLPPHAVVDCGSGWYHESAIQDAARTTKP